MKRIILASGSPRRRQLLEQVGIPHEVIISNADETIDGPPEVQVKTLALRKAHAVCCMIKDDIIVIAADTLVFIDGKVLGKPNGPDDAFNMLKTLQGRGHTVYTGVAVLKIEAGKTITESFVEATQVYFRKLSDAEIWDYVNTGEPFDKAGSYGVQEKGALLVERVNGDFYNVVGLPVVKLAVVLSNMGVAVWK